MQTSFTPSQLADPDIKVADGILRKCVHCGFCTATCPTFVLLGDELDSPRGRIYLIKDMLENDKPASPQVAKHIDRCLSCLSCMTTCPSGVDYMHLVDHARVRVEETYRRPLAEKALRRLISTVLVRPWLFRLSLIGAKLARPFAWAAPGRLKGLLTMAPATASAKILKPMVYPAKGPRLRRVAILPGCVQQVVGAAINDATIRLLTRHGCEVVVADGVGCCGALQHHMGEAQAPLGKARANVAAWTREIEGEGLDAIVINASGCGTTIKDYGFMLRLDSQWAAAAARVSAITRDITEVMADIGLNVPSTPTDLVVAYHSACSMQHGQRIRTEPKRLLEAAGFIVREPPEGHICCGSAGTYNILQPDLATQLRDRKVANIESLAPQVIATGNIGCMMQIGGGTAIPIVHTVELLDWATGGPKPAAL